MKQFNWNETHHSVKSLNASQKSLLILYVVSKIIKGKTYKEHFLLPVVTNLIPVSYGCKIQEMCNLLLLD